MPNENTRALRGSSFHRSARLPGSLRLRPDVPRLRGGGGQGMALGYGGGGGGGGYYGGAAGWNFRDDGLGGGGGGGGSGFVCSSCTATTSTTGGGSAARSGSYVSGTKGSVIITLPSPLPSGTTVCTTGSPTVTGTYTYTWATPATESTSKCCQVFPPAGTIYLLTSGTTTCPTAPGDYYGL